MRRSSSSAGTRSSTQTICTCRVSSPDRTANAAKAIPAASRSDRTKLQQAPRRLAPRAAAGRPRRTAAAARSRAGRAAAPATSPGALRSSQATSSTLKPSCRAVARRRHHDPRRARDLVEQHPQRVAHVAAARDPAVDRDADAARRAARSPRTPRTPPRTTSRPARRAPAASGRWRGRRARSSPARPTPAAASPASARSLSSRPDEREEDLRARRARLGLRPAPAPREVPDDGADREREQGAGDVPDAHRGVHSRFERSATIRRSTPGSRRSSCSASGSEKR